MAQASGQGDDEGRPVRRCPPRPRTWTGQYGDLVLQWRLLAGDCHGASRAAWCWLGEHGAE